MTDVMARVQKHYDAAVAHYGKTAVFGVFLYGSWNYGTNLPDSDVDTKCILIPDLYTLAINPYEVKHLHIDDEICECMSIMHMVANWKKQNINFLEIMFTPYCIVNPLYADFWIESKNINEVSNPLTLEWAEKIAHYDIKKAVLSMANQAIHTLNQDAFSLKKIMNGARIANSLARLVQGISYAKVIESTKGIAQIRTGETPIFHGFVEDLIIFFQDMIGRANEFAHLNADRKEVDYFLNRFILELIEFRISELN